MVETCFKYSFEIYNCLSCAIRIKTLFFISYSKDGSSQGNSSRNEEISNHNNLEDSDIEDCDSKETRLTLMEEVLLLGLKDKEVNSQDWKEINSVSTPIFFNLMLSFV